MVSIVGCEQAATSCFWKKDAEVLYTCFKSDCIEVYEKMSSHLIYCLSKLVPNDFMILVSSFKSSIQHEVHFINNSPT